MAVPNLDGPPIHGPGLCECGCGQKTSLATQTNRRRGYVKGKPMRFVVGHSGGQRRHNRPIIRDDGYRLIAGRTYKDPARMYVRPNKPAGMCRSCMRRQARERRAEEAA